DPALRALPTVFVVRVSDGEGVGWIQASIDYVASHSAPGRDSMRPIATRLPELVLIEVLRAHLSSGRGLDRGWLAALRDPVLAPALSLLHAEPQRRWTVGELASNAAVSRSLLDERFRLVLGRAPIR